MSRQDSDGSGLLYRYRFGSVVFDEARLELRVKELPVDIEPRPLDLLSMLLGRGGRVVTKDELIETVWRGEEVMEAVIPSAVKKLRRALTEENSAYIVTVHGKGYRFDINHGTGVERSPVGTVQTSSLDLRPDQAVPHRNGFVLERLLGQSKGAEVWLARCPSSGEHRVFKFAVDNVRLSSIRREVTLSRLLHEALGERPDILRIHDWNLEHAPFFVESEYGGQNLAAWAVDDNRLTSMPNSARLELFLAIAEALRAAHSIGVLHKDLKPTNILMTPAPHGWSARVADFGSGRLLDAAQLQHYGIDPLGLTLTQGVLADSRSGTPFYLAPELLSGQPATQKSDVYSLGLILYQLLAGDFRKPLSPGWERDIDDELLRTDIAAATDGDPRLRIASVAELIDRLQRLSTRRSQQLLDVEHKNIAVRAQRELERSRARRPWIVTALASLTVALAISIAMYHGQSKAHRQADIQRLRAEAITAFLNDDVLGAADPITPGSSRDATIKDALARAEKRLDGRFLTDPVTKASIQLALGSAYFGQSDYDKAEVFQRQAVTLLDDNVGPGDELTLEAEYLLVRTLNMHARYAETDTLLARADSHAGERLHTPSRLALLALWSHAGNSLMQMQPVKALGEYEEADRIRMKVAANDPVWLFRIRGNLAWCYVRLNRSEEAVAALTALMDPAHSPEKLGILDWAKVHMQYGLALTNLSRFQEAEQVMIETVRESERVSGPQNYLTGLAWSHVATTYQAEGRWDEAMDADQRAYLIMEKCLGPRGQATLFVSGNLATLDYLAGRLDRAVPALRSAHDALAMELGKTAPFTQIVDFYLAAALSETGRSTDAWSLAAHLEPEALAAADASGHWDPRVQGLKGQILMRTGQTSQARVMLGSALAALQREKAQAWMLIPLERPAIVLKPTRHPSNRDGGSSPHNSGPDNGL